MKCESSVFYLVGRFCWFKWDFCTAHFCHSAEHWVVSGRRRSKVHCRVSLVCSWPQGDGRLYLDPKLYPHTTTFLHEMCTFLSQVCGSLVANDRRTSHFEWFPERLASHDGDSALVRFARTASRSSGEWSRLIWRRNRDDAEETATRLLRVWRSRACVEDEPSCQEGLLRDVFRYWSKWLEPSPLQATE